MGIQERKARDKENLHQTILNAAEDLFVRQGFENVSMRKIAAAIEYSPTTIYLYFKDKNQLFYCLLDQYYEKLNQLMQTIQDENESPLDCIRKGMRMYTEFGLSNPNYYKLAFMLTPEIRPEEYLKQKFASTKLFFTLRDNVRCCIEKKLFVYDDVDLVTQIIWSMNHGITSLLLTNPNFPWIDKDTLIDEYIKCTLKGLM